MQWVYERVGCVVRLHNSTSASTAHDIAVLEHWLRWKIEAISSSRYVRVVRIGGQSEFRGNYAVEAIVPSSSVIPEEFVEVERFYDWPN